MTMVPSVATADTFLDVGGGLAGWTTKGSTVVQNTTATSNYGGTPFTLTPAVGEHMVKITADGSSVNVGAVDGLLGLNAGTAAAAISSGSTNFGLITKSYSLQTGTYTFGWAYAAGDYLPFSDGVFFSVGGQGVSKFNILARNGASSIVPGAAGYPVGALILQSYGNTPWITASFDVSTAGNYQLGFGGFNALDTGLSPVLFVSAVVGTFTGTPVGSSGGTPTPPPSNDIDTAAPGGYDASQLGTALNAVFTGGTLYFTTGGQTYAQNFVLGNAATNTINLSGLSTTFSGNFTDQSSNGSLIFTNTGTGGVVVLSGANTYTGATTIGDGAQVNLTGTISNTSSVLIQNGGYLVIDTGGALTAGGVTNNAGGRLFIAQGASLTDDMDNAGETENAGTSNAIVNTNTGTIINAATGVWNGEVRSNTGTLTNAGIWNGDIATSGTFANTGTLNGDLSNTGSAEMSGTVNGAATNAGTLSVSGALEIGQILNSGNLTVATGGALTADGVSNQLGGTLLIAENATLANDIDNAGAIENAGTSNAVVNSNIGTIVNTATGIWNGTAGNNAGTLTNAGVWTGNIANSGTFANTGTLNGDLSNADTAQLSGTINGAVTNTGNLATSGVLTANSVSTSGMLANTGILTAALTVTNGTTVNTGTVNGAVTVNGGTFASTNTLNGDFANAGTAQLSGTVNGTVTNTHNLSAARALETGQVLNSGTLAIGSGGALTADGVSNQLGGILLIAQGATLTDDMDNAGAVENAGTSNAIVNTNTGTIVNTATGVWTGEVRGNTGTLSNAGAWTGDIANSGTFANAGTLTGNLTNAGTAQLSGTLNGTVTNTGSLSTLASLTANSVSTSGTLVNSGALTAALNVTGGTAINSGTVNGAVTVNGGAFATTGTLNGALTNAATVQARGAVNGAVANAGTLALTGTLTGNGSAFGNTGTLTIDHYRFEGFGTVTNAAGATIHVGTLDNSGSLNAVSLSNAGTVQMANGRTGDVITVTGGYTGMNGSILSFDVNLMTGQADHLSAGTLSGTSTVRINNIANAKTYLASPVVLVAAGDGSGTLTADSDAGTTAALASHSLINYSLRKIDGTSNWGIVSTLHTPALTSLTASLTSYVTAQTLNLADLPDEAFVRDGAYGVNQLVGNSWARAFTGDLSLEQAFTISDAYSANTTTKALSSQDGMQFGFDAGVFNINGTGASLRVGLMGGTTNARVTDETLAGANVRIDAPNYGFYTALTHNGLRLSVQNRNEIMKTDVTNPVLGLANSRLKARSETLAVTLSKRFDVKSAFIEPVAGYMITKVDTDALHVPNDMGSIKIPVFKSSLARAGVRFGMSLTTRDVDWTPYGELNAWQEQADETQTAYLPTQPANPVWLAGQRTGSFGQALVGVRAQSRSNENLSGYVTADVRRGETLEGWTVRAGVKYRMQ